ncbi:hypothetical protein [uncultured Roseobacter sp.]|uniref:hypothetical protein n=1 Tax=uncultured Roseobacter sp. TaxID=114847 RepID=UPI002626BBA1|nr:hypothetical protein [uncultured Roseobacter sp.]
MAVQDRLDDLRTRFKGCDIAAFGDLSTGLVFATSTSKKVEQEHLDALCQQAKEHLCGQTTQHLSKQLFDNQRAPFGAISIMRGSATCYLKSLEVDNEALFLVCDLATPLAEIMEAATAVLTDLVKEA